MKNTYLKDFHEGRSLDAYRHFGAHPEREGVRFTVYAPNAQAIQVIGSFDDWECEGHEMKKVDERGTWSLYIKGVKVGDSYKYRITQATGRVVDKMDPYAFYSELRPNTASVVEDLSNDSWEDAEWLKSRSKNFDRPVNIYEVHIGSWMKEEDEDFVNYRKIAGRLIEYVKENHFTHIELMPLCEYPFDGSWGYQCSGYYSVTSRYGTCHDLMYLVNEAHKAGIGVIMDFVPVHFVKDDFSLSYFDGTALYEYPRAHDADSQWGTANFDLWKEEVRSFLMSAASFWIDVYHFDGLRMDAISNAIFWHGNKQLGVNEGALDFIKRMNFMLNEKYKGKIMLIAEDSTDFPNVTKSTLDGGLGFDYKWDLGWMNDTLNYLKKDPVYRKWHHNNITFSMAYFYSERFLIEFSHDEVVHGKATIINKMWGTYEQKFAQLRTLYLYMFTHPGKKLNFMGNELAHWREWDEQKENDWFLLSYPAHDAFHKYFALLGELYTEDPTLYEKDYSWESFEWIDADNADKNMFSYLRKGKDKDYVIILNFSPNMYRHEVFGVASKGSYREIINTEWERFGGTLPEQPQQCHAARVSRNNKPYMIEADIPPFGGVLLEVQKDE
ncbi:MAG TPA: 1,4-alpha-glucan branching protein GlgB [Candidatus Merdibacter merdavium]|uniref:1,4-alpha-glucan branching enzyme n=1 Tax=Candidatus Merdibacter merdavium TaxID=2838692 RepID=A0A9D2SWJ0_9FIRM|nr:1,4-alpha-glucan branching protein GlgB [Candidatus Merdibacter merdavium]